MRLEDALAAEAAAAAAAGLGLAMDSSGGGAGPGLGAGGGYTAHDRARNFDVFSSKQGEECEVKKKACRYGMSSLTCWAPS